MTRDEVMAKRDEASAALERSASVPADAAWSSACAKQTDILNGRIVNLCDALLVALDGVS